MGSAAAALTEVAASQVAWPEVDYYLARAIVFMADVTMDATISDTADGAKVRDRLISGICYLNFWLQATPLSAKTLTEQRAITAAEALRCLSEAVAAMEDAIAVDKVREARLSRELP